MPHVRVRRYYDTFGQQEWERPAAPADGAIEFAVTCHALAIHIGRVRHAHEERISGPDPLAWLARLETSSSAWPLLVLPLPAARLSASLSWPGSARGVSHRARRWPPARHRSGCTFPARERSGRVDVSARHSAPGIPGCGDARVPARGCGRSVGVWPPGAARDAARTASAPRSPRCRRSHTIPGPYAGAVCRPRLGVGGPARARADRVLGAVER